MSDKVPKIDLGLLFAHSVAYIKKFRYSEVDSLLFLWALIDGCT